MPHTAHCHLCSTVLLRYLYITHVHCSTRCTHEGAGGGLYGLLFAVLALIPERGCRSFSIVSLAHIYSLALFTSNSCVPSRHRWFSLSSQPIALGESGADVHGSPRRSSGESVSSASSSSKVSMGVSREKKKTCCYIQEGRTVVIDNITGERTRIKAKYLTCLTKEYIYRYVLCLFSK